MQTNWEHYIGSSNNQIRQIFHKASIESCINFLSTISFHKFLIHNKWIFSEYLFSYKYLSLGNFHSKNVLKNHVTHSYFFTISFLLHLKSRLTFASRTFEDIVIKVVIYALDSCSSAQRLLQFIHILFFISFQKAVWLFNINFPWSSPFTWQLDIYFVWVKLLEIELYLTKQKTR